MLSFKTRSGNLITISKKDVYLLSFNNEKFAVANKHTDFMWDVEGVEWSKVLEQVTRKSK